MKKCLMAMICTAIYLTAAAQISGSVYTNPSKNVRIFMAYELGEMAFNRFQNFSGELGIRLTGQQRLRLVYQNVKLTEQHLSSKFATSVSGENIQGLMQTYELTYDHSFGKIFHGGISLGYAQDYYEHTYLHESVSHGSGTVGLFAGFGKVDVFGIKGLYYKFELPFRLYFNPLEATKLGESMVNRHEVVNNIWFFVGYQF